MSTTASELIPFQPYPALCPWLTTMRLVGRITRLTIRHESAEEVIDVIDFEKHFASAFQRALKIKHAMVDAEQVAQALAGDSPPRPF